MSNELGIIIIGAVIALGIGFLMRRTTRSSPGRGAPASLPTSPAQPYRDFEKKADQELPSRSQSYAPPPPQSSPSSSTQAPPAPSAPPQVAPDFDSMSAEEMMHWMDALAKQEEKTEGFASGEDIEELYIDEDEAEEETNDWQDDEFGVPTSGPGGPPSPIVIDRRNEIDELDSPASPEPQPEQQELITDLLDLSKTEDKSPEKIDGILNEQQEQVKQVVDNKPASPTADVSTAHFSAFYPETAEVNQRHGIYIYAHAEHLTDVIQQDVAKFLQELGGSIPQPKVARDSKALAHGTKITVLPESDELEFEPDILTKRWEGDWKRYEFEFRPKEDLAGDTAFVRVSIMVMGFEIARIKFAIDITEPEMTAMSIEPMSLERMPDNPLARAKLQHAVTSGYDKIFISYSRQDKLVAQAFKLMQEAAGHDVFLDVEDIRAGEDWQAALARAIDTADFVQLFWSEHSATSEFCRYEWDYALNYRCQDDMCRDFIRPVWWRDPFPQPPPELSHLNFKCLNVEALMADDD